MSILKKRLEEIRNENMGYQERRSAAYKAEKALEYRKWLQEIPAIKLDPEWEIQVIPPFSAAVVRFRIKQGDATVSIYLDCYDFLGIVGEPYWEVYPYDGDTFRCLMNETEALTQAIRKSISQQ